MVDEVILVGALEAASGGNDYDDPGGWGSLIADAIERNEVVCEDHLSTQVHGLEIGATPVAAKPKTKVSFFITDVLIRKCETTPPPSHHTTLLATNSCVGGVLVSFFSKGSPAFRTVLSWDRTDWGWGPGIRPYDPHVLWRLATCRGRRVRICPLDGTKGCAFVNICKTTHTS